MFNKLWHNKKTVLKLLSWLHFLSRRGLLVLAWQQRLLFKVVDQYDRIREQEIYDKYQVTIDKYQDDTFLAEASTEPAKIIWVLWWQGADQMPQIIQATLKSMHDHAGDYQVTLIDQHNFQQYLTVPTEILAKVETGAVGLAAFSDYLRYALLAQYGGIWLDATMYLVADIPAFDDALEVVLPKHVNTHSSIRYSPIFQRYQHTFIKARKNTLFMRYMVDVITTYLLTEPRVNRYPYAYDIALLGFEHVPRLTAMFDQIPARVNFDMEAFEELTVMPRGSYREFTETFAYKLTYKDEAAVEKLNKVFELA
ncbi:MAG: capsular polysaccharide synthesis protein [Lactobacillaceae bacterium]|jgi:hypothetical protein|nr:capsular polysaccharide synthesis protein [Lactobacillaceae bacterium]